MFLLKMMLKCLNSVTRVNSYAPRGRNSHVTWMRKSSPMVRYNVVRSRKFKLIRNSEFNRLTIIIT